MSWRKRQQEPASEGERRTSKERLELSTWLRVRGWTYKRGHGWREPITGYWFAGLHYAVDAQVKHDQNLQHARKHP